MSATNALETSILGLLLNASAIANIADNAGSSPATNLYLSLHTSDPGEGGSQTTNECAYTSYARAAVARTSSGWTVSGASAVLTSAISFPAATGGTETATHFGLGTASSGTGVLMFKGAITPNISISTGVTPQLTTSTTISAD